MALFKFTKGILEGTPIDIYNHGEMYRDFTYVGGFGAWHPLADGRQTGAPKGPRRHRGRRQPVTGRSLGVSSISAIRKSCACSTLSTLSEEVIGKEAIRNYMDMQTGDVPATWADADLLQRLTGYKPQTSFRDGVEAFVNWYMVHYDRA